MKSYLKNSSLILSILPGLSFAIQPGYYGDVGIGVSAGPSSVVAPGSRFHHSGGTLTGGVTDLYGLNSHGAVGAYANIGYNLRPNFGFEANYTYWGRQTLSTFTGQITTATGGMHGDLTSQSVGGNLVGYIPFDNDRFNVFAKIGAAAMFSTLEVDDPNNVIFFNPGSYSQSTTRAALTYGAGVNYQYNERVSFQLSWNGISTVKVTPISNLYYNMASIGIRYTIPNALPTTHEK